MAYGAAVAAGSIDYLRGHLANSHRAVRRRVEVGGAGRGVRNNGVGHGGLLRWLTAAHNARLSTVEDAGVERAFCTHKSTVEKTAATELLWRTVLPLLRDRT